MLAPLCTTSYIIIMQGKQPCNKPSGDIHPLTATGQRKSKMKELSRMIMRNEELQKTFEAVRKNMVVDPVSDHRVLCAGRIFKIKGKIVLQAERAYNG